MVVIYWSSLIFLFMCVVYLIINHRNKLKGEKIINDTYSVRMCANCGCEENMYFMERWCKGCRGIR